MNKVVVIRIRGGIGVKKTLKDTMSMLRLYKKHTCVILNNTPSTVGMVKKLKDYVTWGEIDEPTIKLLLSKRGKLPGNKPLTEEYVKEKLKLTIDEFTKEFVTDKKQLKDIPGFKQFFRLSPPIKGFERKGIKKPFSLGGSLGYRKDKINELIHKMI